MLLVEIGENKMLLACHDNLVSKFYLFYLHDFISSFFRMEKLLNAHGRRAHLYRFLLKFLHVELTMQFYREMSGENLEVYFF